MTRKDSTLPVISGALPESLSRYRRRAMLLLAALVSVNLLVWLTALLVFHRFPLLLGTAALAYGFGLRHAIDADHLSAIDNVTRKMMHDGKRPVGIGFFFSLGHSTIVLLLSAIMALTAFHIQNDFPQFQHVGSLVGTSVSALFLLAIAALNAIVLYEVIQAYRRSQHAHAHAGEDAHHTHSFLHGHSHAHFVNPAGIMGRIFGPVLRLADKSWKMYFIGFLFGLGFDTATEVGLLGISATTATTGLPIWAILLFPALFAAGMCLIDTLDGILMLGIYQWAYVHPVRKLRYNMAITTISILTAGIIGGIEALGVIGDRFALHGPFWDAVGSTGDHFTAVGLCILGVFIASWGASAIIWMRLGKNRPQQKGAMLPVTETVTERMAPFAAVNPAHGVNRAAPSDR